jgi:hypothetical protein
MQIWAYKKQREIARRLSTYRGELALGHPKFPEGSQAALVDRDFGGDNRLDLPPIQYGKEDEKAIEQWIRENLNTTWHSSKHKSLPFTILIFYEISLADFSPPSVHMFHGSAEERRCRRQESKRLWRRPLEGGRFVDSTRECRC